MKKREKFLSQKRAKKVSIVTAQTALSEVKKMMDNAPESDRILIWNEFMRIVDRELKWRGL